LQVVYVVFGAVGFAAYQALIDQSVLSDLPFPSPLVSYFDWVAL
jgi:hypothetical protein